MFNKLSSRNVLRMIRKSNNNLNFNQLRFAHNKTIVHTDQGPPAVGPYNQAVKVNGMVFVSGCLGLDPKSGEMIGESNVEQQTEAVMSNMGAILKAANSSFDQVVKCTVLMASMDDYATINSIYAKYFDEATAPARAAFAVKTLPKNALVEIECVATHD